MAFFDSSVVEAELKEAAAAAGVSYDPSDLAGIDRNTSYSGDSTNKAVSLDDALANQKAIYEMRASNVPNGGGEDDGGGSSVSGAPSAIRPFGQSFSAPTPGETPGFKFRLGEALQAVERSGLAKGTYFTNRTGKALEEQAAGIAEDYYGQDFNRALAGYETNRGTAWGDEDRRFASERTNRMDDFGIMDANRKFEFGASDSDRNFDRALSNDQWSRGSDLWSMGRTDQNDQFQQNLSIADMLQRYRPRPA